MSHHLCPSHLSSPEPCPSCAASKALGDERRPLDETASARTRTHTERGAAERPWRTGGTGEHVHTERVPPLRLLPFMGHRPQTVMESLSLVSGDVRSLRVL